MMKSSFSLFLVLPLVAFAHDSVDLELSVDEDTLSLKLNGSAGERWTIQRSEDLKTWINLDGGEAVEIPQSGVVETAVSAGDVKESYFQAVSAEPGSSLPLVYQLFDDSLEVYQDGDFIVIETTNVPNHPSPYFSNSDSRYEAYNGTNPNFRINPNSIETQTMVYRIPVNPTEASNKTNTRLGSIGIAVNGVAFFNQYAGPNNQPLTFEVDSFDQYNGHPQNSGVYHYHFEPIYLTGNNGRGSLVGVLLDGFPVYGPEENGEILTSEDLDDYHGHFGPTPEHPEGIYHYHFTDDLPYLNGGQYFGTPGTQTN